MSSSRHSGLSTKTSGQGKHVSSSSSTRIPDTTVMGAPSSSHSLRSHRDDKAYASGSTHYGGRYGNFLEAPGHSHHGLSRFTSDSHQLGSGSSLISGSHHSGSDFHRSGSHLHHGRSSSHRSGGHGSSHSSSSTSQNKTLSGALMEVPTSSRSGSHRSGSGCHRSGSGSHRDLVPSHHGKGDVSAARGNSGEHSHSRTVEYVEMEYRVRYVKSSENERYNGGY